MRPVCGFKPMGKITPALQPRHYFVLVIQNCDSEFEPGRERAVRGDHRPTIR